MTQRRARWCLAHCIYFDKVPTGCQVSNAGTDVCVRVRECVRECVRACTRVCDAITSTVSLYQQNQL